MKQAGRIEKGRKMMIIWVNDKEMENYLPLIPERMHRSVLSGDWFCLGALADPVGTDDDGTDSKVAAGVLLFSSEEGISYGQIPADMILLRWIYVDPVYRERGIANELMEAFSDVLKDNPADGILCDIPFGREYDLAESFLSDWGFEFEVIEDLNVTITKKDARNLKEREDKKGVVVRPSKENGVLPLKEIPPEMFHETFHKIVAQTKVPYYGMASDDPAIYDGEVSCGVMKDGVLSSLILFERFSERDYQLAMMMSLSPKAAVELRDMMLYSAIKLYVMAPEDAEIHVILGGDRSIDLFSFFFPDRELPLVRRGFYA